MPYNCSRVRGVGTNKVDVLTANGARVRATLRNIGPSSAWLGNADVTDSTAAGVRLWPGDTLVLTSPSPVYATTWPACLYVLEVIDE